MTAAARAAEELRRIWRGDAEGEAYHGLALGPVLGRVGARQAGWRVPGTHSIHEVLVHMLAWREWTLARLRGPRLALPVDDGWKPLEPPDDAGWRALLARSREVEDDILAAVAGLDDAALEKHREALRFVLHHDLHHGGQIGYLGSASSQT